MDKLVGGLHGAHLRSDVVNQLGVYGARRALRTGRLRPTWPRVLVEAARSTALHTRAGAARLAFPMGVIAGPTATQLHGLDAMTTPRTHVLLPYENYARPTNGLVVHNGRLPDEEIDEVDGLRVLRLDRALADLLCRAAPRDALAVTDQALARARDEDRQRLRSAIGRRIDARADPRGTVRGRELLALATGRAASPPESWLHLLLVENGFPHPEVNWPIHSPDGREVYFLDQAWPELRIAVEYDGYAAHANRLEQDRARDEDLRRRGWIVVRVRIDDLTEPAEFFQQLRAAFRRRGYTW
jgi:hypothetical protein